MDIFLYLEVAMILISLELFFFLVLLFSVGFVYFFCLFYFLLFCFEKQSHHSFSLTAEIHRALHNTILFRIAALIKIHDGNL